MTSGLVHTLHLIDDRTPVDMLNQLALLHGPDEPILCLGAPPKHALAAVAQRIDAPFRLKDLAGWKVNPTLIMGLVHAWSTTVLTAAQRISYEHQCPLVLSLPAAPLKDAHTKMLKLCRQAGESAAQGRTNSFTLTLPTDVARKALLVAGAPGPTVATLPPAAAPIDRVPERRAATRAALDIADDQILLVAVGDMVRWGGQKYAAWAHAILRQVHQNVRLMLPGDGPFLKPVRFFAGTTGYQNEVHITCDRFEQADALAAADIALFFVEQNVGVSALAAAMMAGLPIAASATSDAAWCLGAGPTGREEIAWSPTGILTPPAHPRLSTAAILEFLDHPDKARQAAQRAAQRARDLFNAERVRGILHDLYASLRGASATGPRD